MQFALVSLSLSLSLPLSLSVYANFLKLYSSPRNDRGLWDHGYQLAQGLDEAITEHKHGHSSHGLKQLRGKIRSFVEREIAVQLNYGFRKHS